MKVRIQKLDPRAVTPVYAKSGDAGIDFTAISREYSSEKNYWIYKTGWAIEIPLGYVGLIFPRSSIRNTSFRLSNSVGVIDSGYRGEMLATFKFDQGDRGYLNLTTYKENEKIFQLIILPYPQIELEEADSLSTTERGDSGFGSSN